MTMTKEAQTLPLTSPQPTTWMSMYAFGRAILRTAIRNWRMTLGLVFTPALMLIVFRFFGSDANVGESDMFTLFFPGIVTMTVIFAGVPLATRLIVWREQEIFRRLACTPQPLGYLIIAMMGADLIIAMLQAFVILFAGVVLLQADVNGRGILLAIPFLFLAALCFLAYGSMLATFVKKAESAASIYTFTVLPMAFIGTLFMPPEGLPEIIQTIGKALPPSLAADPVRMALLEGHLPAQWPLMFGGLLTYIIIFATMSSRRFRWQ